MTERQFILDSLSKVIENKRFYASEARQFESTIITACVSSVAILASALITFFTIRYNTKISKKF